ncbi:9697_t:CDS:2 [Cetraspora pellucida]|uniref:9697_t:CDS:1 n=1 Tax=Cetraspora pellucida TaxID=1433469 RepID=A0A9N9JJI9_9GLOM|nr:9697_t:CDS:2 [Cetraspora pellucida]
MYDSMKLISDVYLQESEKDRIENEKKQIEKEKMDLFFNNEIKKLANIIKDKIRIPWATNIIVRKRPSEGRACSHCGALGHTNRMCFLRRFAHNVVNVVGIRKSVKKYFENPKSRLTFCSCCGKIGHNRRSCRVYGRGAGAANCITQNHLRCQFVYYYPYFNNIPYHHVNIPYQYVNILYRQQFMNISQQPFVFYNQNIPKIPKIPRVPKIPRRPRIPNYIATCGCCGNENHNHYDPQCLFQNGIVQPCLNPRLIKLIRELRLWYVKNNRPVPPNIEIQLETILDRMNRNINTHYTKTNDNIFNHFNQLNQRLIIAGKTLDNYNQNLNQINHDINNKFGHVRGSIINLNRNFNTLGKNLNNEFRNINNNINQRFNNFNLNLNGIFDKINTNIDNTNQQINTNFRDFNQRINDLNQNSQRLNNNFDNLFQRINNNNQEIGISINHFNEQINDINQNICSINFDNTRLDNYLPNLENLYTQLITRNNKNFEELLNNLQNDIRTINLNNERLQQYITNFENMQNQLTTTRNNYNLEEAFNNFRNNIREMVFRQLNNNQREILRRIMRINQPKRMSITHRRTINYQLPQIQNTPRIIMAEMQIHSHSGNPLGQAIYNPDSSGSIIYITENIVGNTYELTDDENDNE